MIELGRSEEVILEMDRLAKEDHTHIATEEEIDVYRGNWWIRSNVVNFDTMPTRRQPDFKKALSTLHRLKKAKDNAHYENWSQSSSSWWQWQTSWWHPIMRPHHKDGLNTDRTGKPVIISESSFYLWHESHKIWCTIYSDYIGNSQRSSLSSTGGVKSTSPVTENHNKNGYVNYKNFIMTNEDNHDTKHTINNDTNNHNAHDLHK